ncbi:MAG TPA: nitroreductase [Pseudonocardiaceae bacterium]|nr:nitroreductase [Pseudonocardiaceae bacterium]
MELAAAIRTRRSEYNFIDPAPSDEEFIHLLESAATAPDHGRLRPWRWILVRGHSRLVLGFSFAADCPRAESRRAATHPLRAPLLATLVFCPRSDHRIPRWEQFAATCCMANSLMLLLHDRGYGSMWKTGSFTESADARTMLDLRRSEPLLGWLYIGTPDPAKPLPPRIPDPVTGKVTTFNPARSVRETRREGQLALSG